MAKWVLTVGVALALAGSASAGFGSVVSSFQMDWYATGLAWDGTYLWYWGVNHAGRFLSATTTGSVVSTFGGSHYTETGGATFDGEYLWCTERMNAPPYPAQVLRFTTGGSSVYRFFHYPSSTPGLAYENGYLWVDSYKYTTTGSWVNSFPEPMPFLYDTAWDGSFLWLNWGSSIYRMTTSGSLAASITTPGITDHGVTFDGEYLWVGVWINPISWTFQYDIGVTAVEPASLGKVKALYR